MELIVFVHEYLEVHAWFTYPCIMISFPGGATNVSFHVTVMSLDTIDEGSMVRSFVRPISPCHNKAQNCSKVAIDILDT